MFVLKHLKEGCLPHTYIMYRKCPCHFPFDEYPSMPQKMVALVCMGKKVSLELITYPVAVKLALD